ncbi:glycine cleavage system protein H [Desulfomonile tiedjei]|uniref:Glycine cleavage system H protein (Lipoate-binding) n=1 Tax=Desulfomonile tiedjei (strain ATCC 49306 / DSM 6799 / DCB-1) TaxID=706587 RepID=I4C1N0_DESTA|nr:glycine cleavage system protein GcvH [Desulfomonile tiedjei]AFM23471.1 glycine cleavage system H protein (lipoate-binding) [Desulfomonile tiedjei DSM 6799]
MEIQGYNMPDDLYYEEHHFWVRTDGNILVMGMDDFAQQLAGMIVYVQLPFEGKALQTGKKFAKVESGKWLGIVYAPVDGEIESSNQELATIPTLINEDCYGAGWMFRIRPKDAAQVQKLIHGRETVEPWLLADIARYKKD